MKISSSMEDYLETIHILEKRMDRVRVKDIADEMTLTMPSVSCAIKNLQKRGLVAHPRYDLISLTDTGTRIAKSVYKRHRVIKSFLTDVLELDECVAEQDACRIEHNISDMTLAHLARFMTLHAGANE